MKAQDSNLGDLVPVIIKLLIPSRSTLQSKESLRARELAQAQNGYFWVRLGNFKPPFDDLVGL